MSKFSEIKGFIFDLDGVISVTSKLHTKAWHQIANKIGVIWTPKLEESLKGVSRVDSLNLILKKGGKENKYSEEEKIKLAEEKNNYYLKLVDKMTKTDVLPGIPDFLQALKDNGYQIALASASKNSFKVLKKIGLANFFEKVVNPADLKYGKPDPEIYLKGADLLELTPKQCIGIEDSVVGIKSINDAGETSIGIGNKKVLNDANIIFSSTKDLTLINIKNALE